MTPCPPHPHPHPPRPAAASPAALAAAAPVAAVPAPAMPATNAAPAATDAEIMGGAALAASRLIVRHDPNTFRLMMLWTYTKARCVNRGFWGGSSYSPLPTDGYRRKGFGRG